MEYSKKKNIKEIAKNFRLIIGAVLITLLLFEGIIMAILLPALNEQATKTAETFFVEAEIEMSLLINSAKETALEVLLDPKISPLLNATNNEMIKGNTLYEGIKQLGHYRSYNERIDSIYIINKRIDYLFSTDRSIYKETASYPDQQFLKWCTNKDNMRKMKKYTFMEVNSMGMNVAQDVYTYILPNRYSEDGVESAVVINMSLEKSAKNYSQYYARDNMYIAVKDSEDTLTELNYLSVENENVFREWWKELIEENIYNDVREYQRVRYSIHRIDFERNNLTYIVIRPWEEIYGVVIRMTKIVANIVVFTLILGMAISLLLSRKVTKLLNKMVEEYASMGKGLEKKSLLSAQREFWRKYLSGQECYGKKQLFEQLEELKITDVKEGNLAILQFENTEQIRTDEIIHIYTKVFEKLSPLYLFREKNNFVFLHKGMKNSCFHALEDGTEHLEKIYHNFNILGNDEVYQVEQFPTVWKNMLLAAKTAFFYPYHKCLNYQKIESEHCDVSNCSNQKLVKEISENFVLGNEEKVMELLNSFFEEIEKKSVESFYNHLSWFHMTLENELAKIYKDSKKEIWREMAFDEFLREMLQCQKEIQVIEKMKEYLLRLMRRISRQANKNVSDKIADMQKYIRSNYKCEQMSIEVISKKFGFAPDYLRKIYKSATDQSISDYIMQIRLEKAAEKLKNTDETAKNIAISCGISNVNYFYTCFKKKYGMSPTVYRSKILGDSIEGEGYDRSAYMDQK